jgi:hypothetical protein
VTDDRASSWADTTPEVHHALGPFEVVAATVFGPRILGLRRGDSPDAFVRLSPEVSIDNPNGEIYRFWGGHRLWVSPEVPEVTYAPDDHVCAVSFGADSLTISAPSDGAGFEKSLHLAVVGETLRVEHRLRWVGDSPALASPWAITQLPLGGVAILPVAGAGDGSPLQADRSLVIWPYTRLNDERISWGKGSVLIDVGPGEPIKLGSGPTPGAVGYFKDGYLFSKRFDSANDEYPDRGAVAQVYANDIFCELESLGALARLEPGDETSHIEVWDLTLCPDLNSAVSAVTQNR